MIPKMNTLGHGCRYPMTSVARLSPPRGGAIGTVYGPPGCAALFELALEKRPGFRPVRSTLVCHALLQARTAGAR
jgi:hypothetical protein